MTVNINNALDAYFKELGYTGSVPDSLNKHLRVLTGEVGSTPDLMSKWLRSLGYTGGLDSMISQHLKALGYSGSTPTMLRDSYLDNAFFGGCYALNFDGVDDYGQFSQRAIDPDGDIDIEFWTPSEFPAGVKQVFVGQSISTSQTSKEFELFRSGVSNNLGITVGGSSATFIASGNYKPSTLYRMTLIGTELTAYENGVLLSTTTFGRGSRREPTAKTTLMARAGSIGEFSKGVVPFIKINGTYWPLDDKGQPVQDSIPSGNPITLFNTTPEQWEEVPCNLRP